MLPALSFHFGINWSHIDTMPAAELETYLDALDDIVTSQQKAARRG